MKQEESSFFTSAQEVAMPEGFSGVQLLYASETGAFCIYATRHLGRRVVLKALKEGYADDAVALTQLHKEFTLGFGVDSPAVCRTLAWHELLDGGGPAIEMEYCEGMSLRQLLDSGVRLSADEVGATVKSALDGLGAIHAAGIVHRDIKPANIMVDRARLTAKVIDFGCADTADYALLKSPAGTPRYTPPEKREGAPEPLPADDLYALGVTMQELAEAADRHDTKTLRRFGQRLCAGRYNTAAQAAADFTRLRKSGTALKIAFAVFVVAIAVGAMVLTLPLRSSEGALPDTTMTEAAPVPLDDAEIERTALMAGTLMVASAKGRTSAHEEADAEVIRFADSLYRADLMYDLLGQKFDAATRRTMAADYAARYAPRLNQRFPTDPDGYHPERRRAMLRARLLASLQCYHQKVE